MYTFVSKGKGRKAVIKIQYLIFKMSGEMPHCYVTGDGPSDTLQTDSPVPLNMLSSGASENSSMDYVLNSGSLNLHLSSKEQAELMAGIEAIFQSDGELPSEDQEMADDDDEEPKVDLEDQQKRTEKLKGILPTLAQLWWCRSEHIDLAAEKLADGSRNCESMTFSAISIFLYRFCHIYLPQISHGVPQCSPVENFSSIENSC